jgi:PPM family protein phosphatase
MLTNPQQQPVIARPRAAKEELQFTASPVRVDASGLSHPGNVRPRNEDHFMIARVGRYLETVLTSLPAGQVPERADEAGYALILADGMGGHVGGELASRTIIRELVRIVLEMPEWIVRLEDRTTAQAAERSRQRIRDLNTLLIERGKQDPELRGMGSTFSAVRNFERVLQIVHVGDSRVYLLRDGVLHRLTRDHTYVQMLVDRGKITKDEAATSAARHVLTNAVGGMNEDVEVDVDRLDLANGDRVLLCSDGLTDLVDDETILALLLEHRGAEPACHALVERALAAGGRDNVTVIVAGYSMDPLE